MPSIILVRHAQGSFGSASYDVLSERGHAQAEAVAAELQRREVAIARVLTGSLARQLDTARPIAAAAGLEVEVDERWNEYESGDLLAHHSTSGVREERTSDDAPAISSRDFQPIIEAALLDWIAAGPGGPAEETFPAFEERVRSALSDAAVGLGSGAAAVVSTSGGVIAAVCVALLGLGPELMVPFNRVTVNTGLSKVAVGRGGFTLVSFNEHGHMEGPDALLTYR
jgi:broad specificity phosphatase PhoE